jgi:hypothetical protein
MISKGYSRNTANFYSVIVQKLLRNMDLTQRQERDLPYALRKWREFVQERRIADPLSDSKPPEVA